MVIVIVHHDYHVSNYFVVTCNDCQVVYIPPYTYLPVSICSHTQELTPSKFLNMSIISLNLTNLPFLSWSHSSAHYQLVNVYPLVAIE